MKQYEIGWACSTYECEREGEGRERERERPSRTTFQRKSESWRLFGRCVNRYEVRIDKDFKEIIWDSVD